jgi:hypothetical protein
VLSLQEKAGDSRDNCLPYTVYVPAGVELDRATAVRYLRLQQLVASSLPVYTLNTLGARY